jgi:hypothetical protein
MKPKHYLRHSPVDVLRGVFDIARLAMQAVLGIDYQRLLSIRAFDVLINLRRAVSEWSQVKIITKHLSSTTHIPAFWPIIHWQVHVRRLAPIAQPQVRRLIGLMRCAGAREISQQVERKHSVGLGVVDFGAFAHWLTGRK